MSNVSSAFDTGEDRLNLSPEAYHELRMARLASAIISFSFDFLATIVFLYLTFYHWSKVSRISFRCAGFCCIVHCLESIIFIVMLEVQGPSNFCFGAALTSQYLALLGVTLLALIGINLVLVYVVNLKKRHLLEYYYYPIALVYSAFGLIGPIIKHYKGPDSGIVYDPGTCWYINIMQMRYGNSVNYMWFFSFIFFTTIVALFSSAVAIIKLLKDHKVLTNIFKSRRQRQLQRQVSFKPVFSQVIVRCILYPIGNYWKWPLRDSRQLIRFRSPKVPFLCYVCSFVMQCMISVTNKYPKYGLTMASTLLTGLVGFFVALIFLNDPVIAQICSGWYDHWFHKQVLEHVTVEIEESKCTLRVLCEVPEEKRTGVRQQPIILVSFAPTKFVDTTMAKLRYMWWYCCNRKTPYPMNRPNDGSHDNNNRDNLVLGTDYQDPIHAAFQHISTSDEKPRQRIPMRRFILSPTSVKDYLENGIHTPHITVQRSFSPNFVVDELINGYFLIRQDEVHYILTPYTSKHYARFIYWALNRPSCHALYRSSDVLMDVTIAYEHLHDRHHNYCTNPQTSLVDSTEDEL